MNAKMIIGNDERTPLKLSYRRKYKFRNAGTSLTVNSLACAKFYNGSGTNFSSQ